MMGVNSPHYVGNTWPDNGGSYNWDAGHFSSWNIGLSSVFSHWGNVGHEFWASRLRRGLQVVCLSTEVVLRRWLWALRLGIVMVLRRGLRALRLDFARVALISLASEAWILLSDDLSSVIFRQSTVSTSTESSVSTPIEGRVSTATECRISTSLKLASTLDQYGDHIYEGRVLSHTRSMTLLLQSVQQYTGKSNDNSITSIVHRQTNQSS